MGYGAHAACSCQSAAYSDICLLADITVPAWLFLPVKSKPLLYLLPKLSWLFKTQSMKPLLFFEGGAVAGLYRARAVLLLQITFCVMHVAFFLRWLSADLRKQ